MANVKSPGIDVEALSDGMRPPTDDDVPMTSDWRPLDTNEKLVAYLTKINDAREREQTNGRRSVAPQVAPHRGGEGPTEAINS